MMFSDIKQTSPSFGLGESPTAKHVRLYSRVPSSPSRTQKSKSKKDQNGGDASMNPKTHNAVIVIEPPGIPVRTDVIEEPDAIDAEVQEVLGPRNIRFISPREMADLALDLYIAGFVGWDEYAALAYQAELQPAYNKTIGALTGRKAEPDRPRDFVQVWEHRVAFERKHMPNKLSLIESSQHIIDVLRELERPLKLVS
jgi:hypothetical protein